MPKQYIEVKPLTDFENVLGYEFKNKELLWQSLTHKSAISEGHPMACHNDLSALAFLGDAALKYAVTRYLILNGRDEVAKNCVELHNNTQKILPDLILANIARDKLHIEEYLIRGNAQRTPSTKMYASCMEAILGAIALDCGTDQQGLLFRVIEKLCSDRYDTLLIPDTTFRFVSAFDFRGNDDEDDAP
ncbi:unnamed protein product [Adineta steineri]|uniref:RNase III domain-containing protein n=1 Tax=Adineta steineri TaxID=433720 RepID=A0A814X3G6_9BILA|nr:unnamed protein product [Adineta steineri]CAF3609977.1 unnamed protein product [Adineta steineri]